MIIEFLVSCTRVFTAGNAICPVFAELQVRDDIAVCALVVVDLLASLDVEKGDLARLIMMMTFGVRVNAHTVALLPMGLKKNRGSSDSEGKINYFHVC
jgi:hypothetical protein